MSQRIYIEAEPGEEVSDYLQRAWEEAVDAGVRAYAEHNGRSFVLYGDGRHFGSSLVCAYGDGYEAGKASAPAPVKPKRGPFAWVLAASCAQLGFAMYQLCAWGVGYGAFMAVVACHTLLVWLVLGDGAR